MLAGLSESVTLTFVVLLVLGSVCYYLYSRILLNENRMSLIESLLMDLKMSNDLRAMDSAEGEVENTEHAENHWDNQPFRPDNWAAAAATRVDVVDVDNDFSDVIAKAVEVRTEQAPTVLLASSEGPSLVSGMPINQEAPLPSGNGQLVSNLDNEKVLTDDGDNNLEEIGSDNTPFLDNLNDIKASETNQLTNVPSASLESMTAKELHSLAKQRRVPGESKMNRAELIEALRAVL